MPYQPPWTEIGRLQQNVDSIKDEELLNMNTEDTIRYLQESFDSMSDREFKDSLEKCGFEVGIDIANEKDYGAICVFCKNCETVIFRKHLNKNEGVLHPIFRKCPNCGVRYVTIWEELDYKLSKLRDEIFRALRVQQIADWLNEKLTL